MNHVDSTDTRPNLFASLRFKVWIAAIGAAILAVGVLTRPPATPGVEPVQEVTAPLLGEEVQRREQLRLFGELQQRGPAMARHSVTVPAVERPDGLPSDVAPPPPRTDPAGHGLIISVAGEVLTTAAAIGGRETLEVELSNAGRATARVTAYDPDTDLVLLTTTGVPGTDAAPWAMEPPPAGMLAMAVTHASGHAAVVPVFVSTGADADRRIRTTTADLITGTPLFTVDGEVFAIAAGDDDPSAILVAPAMQRLRERIASGQSRRGALGLTFQEREGPLAEAFPGDGVLIADVALNGPADDAGVLPGDVLTAIGDIPMTTIDETRAVIAALAPDSEVTLQVSRARKPVLLTARTTSALGLRVRQVPRRPDDDAVEARRLFADAALAASDLRRNSRVLSIAGRRVASIAEARAALPRAGGAVLLYVEDDRGRFFRAVEADQ